MIQKVFSIFGKLSRSTSARGPFSTNSTAPQFVKRPNVHVFPEELLHLSIALNLFYSVPLLLHAVQYYAQQCLASMQEEEVEDVGVVLGVLLLEHRGEEREDCGSEEQLQDVDLGDVVVEGGDNVLPEVWEIREEGLLQRLQNCVELWESVLVHSAPLVMPRHVQKHIEAVFFEVLVERPGALGVLHVAQNEACQAVHALAVADVALEVSVGVEDVEEGVLAVLVAPLEVIVLEAAPTDVRAELLCHARRAPLLVVFIDLPRGQPLAAVPSRVELDGNLLLHGI